MYVYVFFSGFECIIEQEREDNAEEYLGQNTTLFHSVQNVELVLKCSIKVHWAYHAVMECA